jgi:hypothetical protein
LLLAGILSVFLLLTFLLPSAKHERLALRNFDTELPYPYRYGFEPNDRLESAANAHTAADLHVRPDP